MKTKYKTSEIPATQRITKRIFNRVSVENKWLTTELLERIKIILELIGLVILIATFVTGVVLAILQYRANEISRKALVTSHIPWIGINTVSTPITSGQRVSMTYEVENFSEYPALNCHFRVHLKEVPGLTETNQYNMASIMPHQRKEMSYDVGSDFATEIGNKIMDRSITVQIDYSYEDEFGNYYHTLQDVQFFDGICRFMNVETNGMPKF